MQVFARIQDAQQERAAERAERWRASREAMARYLSSPEWYAKRDRAFLIWRGLGWAAVAAVLVGHLRLPFLVHLGRVGLAWTQPVPVLGVFYALLAVMGGVLLTWPVQDVAAFGLTYAVLVRGTAIARNRRIRRVGHHIGYTHVDTSRGGPEDGWSGCRERWYEIWPVTQTVNRTESLLRHDRPSPGFGRYFRRTLVAIALVRFWWTWWGFWLVAWFEGALTTHMTWGWALWPAGVSHVLTWLVMVGHRV